MLVWQRNQQQNSKHKKGGKAVWDKALEQAITQQNNFIAVLFVVLLATTMALVKWVLNVNDTREKRMESTNENREKRFIEVIDKQVEIIDKQAKALGCLDALQDDIKDIKTFILSRKVSSPP
jgi:hypothetical protein